MPVEHTPTLAVVNSCKVVAKNSLMLKIFLSQHSRVRTRSGGLLMTQGVGVVNKRERGMKNPY